MKIWYIDHFMLCNVWTMFCGIYGGYVLDGEIIQEDCMCSLFRDFYYAIPFKNEIDYLN